MPDEQVPSASPRNDVERRDDAPPRQTSTVPTWATSTRGAVELPCDLPESSTTHQNAIPDPPSRNRGNGASSSAQSLSQTTPQVRRANEQYRYNMGHADMAASDEEAPDYPPPAYSEIPGQINDESNDMGANAFVAEDGRVNIRINQKSQRLSRVLVPQLQQQLTAAAQGTPPPPPYIPEFLGGAPGQTPPPPLNVVVHVVGSRGDVQPFVALGKVLREIYGHRVRLATHPVFKDFVLENGLEFFSIGGDPAELMAFMVKNPGLMPGFDTLRSGDVGKRRRGIAEILRGTWRSCIETGDGLAGDPLKQSVEEWMDVSEAQPDALKKPFVADAIIANPPSFGHIHCAEKLGIPLHIMFTMPWSPTQQFPHPLANIQATNADASLTNYISYALVDMLTWQGLGDLINRFRKDSLGLDPIGTLWAPNMLARLKIPHTYCWSPALIPKPKDWGPHISISGFFFLNLASNYTPDPALSEFLAAGAPPVYIGFGSIVVDDPNAMTQMIFEAVKKTGCRALVSKGWGGLGADELDIPEGVFMLGNVPHDWLFQHVAAVVHHGGAGTTAAGIKCAKPTVIVPFFGDQPFWGAMTAKAGAGPPPIPYKDLTADKLADAISHALKPESIERARELAELISQEQGSQNGAQSFHQMLGYDDLRCMAAPGNAAVWRVKRTQVRLSAKAAAVLAQEGELAFSELKLFRSREYEADEGPWDPISGGATAIIGTATQMMMGVADFPIETLKLLNIHPDSKKLKPKPKATNSERTGSSSPSNGAASSATPSVSSTTLPGTGTSAGRPPISSAVGQNDASRSSSGTVDTLGIGIGDAQTGSGPSSRRPSLNSQNLASPPETPRPSSRNRLQRPHANTVSSSDPPSEAGTTFAGRLQNMSAESTINTGKGLARIVGASFKSPMDFSLNVAKGFHNVPKLYGGEVRQVDKVTDFQSGMKTAAKEFGLGFYEGITGLVTDPYKGAKKEGSVGFLKGVGKGIAGVPLRVMGGVFAVPGYAMKGLYQEAVKSKGAGVQNYIIAARISQGCDEAQTLSSEERADIISRWRCIKLNVKRKKNVGEEQVEALHKLMKEKRERKLSKLNKLEGHLQRPQARPMYPAQETHSSYAEPQSLLSDDGRFGATQQPLRHASTFSHPPAARSTASWNDTSQQELAEEEAERRELEAAIRASVSETSRGDADEDEMIAQAIRASMAELDRPIENAEDEEEALQRALRASVEEAGRHGASEEEQRVLEETLKASLLDRGRIRRRRRGSDSEWDSSDSDTQDDEEYRRVMEESKAMAELYHSRADNAHRGLQDDGAGDTTSLGDTIQSASSIATMAGAEPTAPDDEEQALKRVLEESERAERERVAALAKQKSDEEIVMEYVKRQSLAEEEHRRRLAAEGKEQGEGSGPAS